LIDIYDLINFGELPYELRGSLSMNALIYSVKHVYIRAI